MVDETQILSSDVTLRTSMAPRTLLYSGSLFDLAASEYGDALGWATIARANGLYDPFLPEARLLVIPEPPTDFGGGVRYA